MISPKKKAAYEKRHYREEAFASDVCSTLIATEWEDVEAADLRLCSSDGEMAEQAGIDRELAASCEEEGMTLSLLMRGSAIPLSSLAEPTLIENAKLSGSALEKMDSESLAMVLTAGLHVGSGSKVLIREDQIMAFHSLWNYVPMDILELIYSIEPIIQSRFGSPVFITGYHSNFLTTAQWELPEKKEEITRMYRDAVKGTASEAIFDAGDIVPGIDFMTSDTAASAASCCPVFLFPSGTTVPLGGGIRVRHEKRTSEDMEPIDLFREGLKGLFSQFQDAAEEIKRLSKVKIAYPVSCMQKLIKFLNKGSANIPLPVQKYAIGEVESMGSFLTAYDVYLALCAGLSVAKEKGYSEKRILMMRETIGKATSADWKRFDTNAN